MSKSKFLIGEVSKMCNISKKTLRYYDSIDVIKPEYISESTGYRYYSIDNLSDIMILKYFKQLGYSLNEIKDSLKGDDFAPILKGLSKKIKELEEEKHLLENRIEAAIEWKSLIDEAKEVWEVRSKEVIIKELDIKEYCCLEQNFNYDYKASIINIPWISALEANGEEIEGPVIINYKSFRDKMSGNIKQATILQKGLNNADKLKKIKYGGKFYSIYHVGELSDLYISYNKLEEYIREYEENANLDREVFERYVLDYWTTQNEKSFVTEILVPVK